MREGWLDKVVAVNGDGCRVAVGEGRAEVPSPAVQLMLL